MLRKSLNLLIVLGLLTVQSAVKPSRVSAQAPGQTAKLFAVSSQGGASTNEVYRYEVLGPADTPLLERTITDSTFDAPCCLAFSAAGELFVINRSASHTAGSISRLLNPTDIPLSNGTITSSNFYGPHWAVFRDNELFIAQEGGGNALRFAVDANGNASFNGAITAGLTSPNPRGVVVSPTGDELFITQCCGVNVINRYLFDASGNAIPSGVITGNGLNNPHDMVFSPWGELFVANAWGNSVSRFVFDGAGNASPNGQITGPTLVGPIGLDFSPWGELFVANHDAANVSRFVFDATHNAIPNGFFATPNTLADIQFYPSTSTPPPPNCGVGTSGLWSMTGSLLDVNIGGVALLNDGRVLVVSPFSGFTQIYDPATGTWSPTGSASPGRQIFGNLVTLQDGRVLIAGGTDSTAYNDFRTAELYDPATGIWSFTGSLNTPRRAASLTLLNDGRVLAAGGRHGLPDGSSFLASAEIYDPATGAWSYTGSLATAREGHAAVRLLNGRVLVFAGEGPWFVIGKTTEVYDPATGVWTRVGDTSIGRLGYATALLPDGRVLAAGNGIGQTVLPLVELFDPATGTWTQAESLNVPRGGASAAVLPDGRVLVAGGYDLNGPNGTINTLTSTEIYDPATGTWAMDANLNVARVIQAGALLRLLDGRILAIGGWAGHPATGRLNSSEIYTLDPSPGTCPTEIALEPASASLFVGQSHTVTATLRQLVTIT